MSISDEFDKDGFTLIESSIANELYLVGSPYSSLGGKGGFCLGGGSNSRFLPPPTPPIMRPWAIIIVLCGGGVFCLARGGFLPPCMTIIV